MDSFEDMCAHVGDILTAYVSQDYGLEDATTTSDDTDANDRDDDDERKTGYDARRAIEAAVSLVVGIRSCAEDTLGPKTTRAALGLMLEKLKPKCSTNYGLLSDVRSTLRQIEGLVDSGD